MSKVKLGEVCEIISGSTPKTAIDDYWNGSFCWVTPAELTDSEIMIIDTERKITQKGVDSCALTLLPVGTVLLSSRAPIGKVAIAGVEMYCNQGFKNLVCSERINNLYLYWFLKSKTEYLNSLGRGATFKEISKRIVENIEIPLPELKKQIVVSNAINRISNLILTYDTQLNKLDELVKSRFVEMFGTVDNNAFDYPVVRLGDYAKLQGGFAFKSKDFVDNGIPLVQIGNVNKDYLDWEVINSVPNEYVDRYSEFSLRDGDLVMAMTRPIIKSLNSVKIAKVAKNDTPCLLNQRVGRFVLSSSLNRLFLETLCKSDDFKDYVERMSGNSLQPNISSKQVEDYLIILPPIELQNQFAEFVTRIEKQKTNY